MEQQCKEAEEAFKMNRMQEAYRPNKVKLLSGRIQARSCINQRGDW